MSDAEIVRLIGRAVEDALIELRDDRISVLGAANGLVIREADGNESPIVRMKTVDAMRIAVRTLRTAGLLKGDSDV